MNSELHMIRNQVILSILKIQSGIWIWNLDSYWKFKYNFKPRCLNLDLMQNLDMTQNLDADYIQNLDIHIV